MNFDQSRARGIDPEIDPASPLARALAEARAETRPERIEITGADVRALYAAVDAWNADRVARREPPLSYAEALSIGLRSAANLFKKQE